VPGLVSADAQENAVVDKNFDQESVTALHPTPVEQLVPDLPQKLSHVTHTEVESTVVGEHGQHSVLVPSHVVEELKQEHVHVTALLRLVLALHVQEQLVSHKHVVLQLV
jgi:hypothetical protein